MIGFFEDAAVLVLPDCNSVHPVKPSAESAEEFQGDLGVFFNYARDAFIDMTYFGWGLCPDYSVTFEGEQFAQFAEYGAWHIDFTEDTTAPYDLENTTFEDTETSAEFPFGKDYVPFFVFFQSDHLHIKVI